MVLAFEFWGPSFQFSSNALAKLLVFGAKNRAFSWDPLGAAWVPFLMALGPPWELLGCFWGRKKGPKMQLWDFLGTLGIAWDSLETPWDILGFPKVCQQPIRRESGHVFLIHLGSFFVSRTPLKNYPSHNVFFVSTWCEKRLHLAHLTPVLGPQIWFNCWVTFLTIFYRLWLELCRTFDNNVAFEWLSLKVNWCVKTWISYGRYRKFEGWEPAQLFQNRYKIA